MLIFCASCENRDMNESLHSVNTRSDSLNVKQGTDIYIEVDTFLNEYDINLTIKTKNHETNRPNRHPL